MGQDETSKVARSRENSYRHGRREDQNELHIYTSETVIDSIITIYVPPTPTIVAS